MIIHMSGEINYNDLSFSNLPKASAEDLIKNIMQDCNINLESYCKANIPADIAAELTFSNPKACRHYFESEGVDPELVLEHMSPKEIAYQLTFEQANIATELLDELLYYRKQGKI